MGQRIDYEIGHMFGHLKLLEEIDSIRVGGRAIRMARLECVCSNIVEKQIKVLKQTTRCCGCTHLKPGYRPSIKVGDKFETSQGYFVEVTEYIDGLNIKAKFTEPVEYEFDTFLSPLKTGSIKNKYAPSIYGIAFMGVGQYDSKKDKKAHSSFTGMIERCYELIALDKRKTYKDCEVKKEWFNFQTFAEWYYQQSKYNHEGWQLDKDILVKGNKIYGPEFCCFVPSDINSLFTKRNVDRGLWPIGVYKHETGKFRASCSNEFMGGLKLNGKLRDTPEEAFEDYKQYKEMVIKQRADFYKDKLDPKVYEALYNYQVEITD